MAPPGTKTLAVYSSAFQFLGHDGDQRFVSLPWTGRMEPPPLRHMVSMLVVTPIMRPPP